MMRVRRERNQRERIDGWIIHRTQGKLGTKTVLTRRKTDEIGTEVVHKTMVCN